MTSINAKISEEDYQIFLNALEQHQQNQQDREIILNNPISRVQQTRTVWSKIEEKIVTEGLVSFDGEEPAWIPLRTIQGIYSYINKTFNSVQI